MHIKETSNSALLTLCEENSSVTGEFPSQRSSNAENVSILWRHHVFSVSWQLSLGAETWNCRYCWVHSNVQRVSHSFLLLVKVISSKFGVYDWLLKHTGSHISNRPCVSITSFQSAASFTFELFKLRSPVIKVTEKRSACERSEITSIESQQFDLHFWFGLYRQTNNHFPLL